MNRLSVRALRLMHFADGFVVHQRSGVVEQAAEHDEHRRDRGPMSNPSSPHAQRGGMYKIDPPFAHRALRRLRRWPEFGQTKPSTVSGRIASEAPCNDAAC